MTDERLYIDGVLVDLPENANITMSVKSNLFRDVSNIVSNTTYTIKLPKTVRNQRILKHADLVQSNDDFPHLLHNARYLRNGVEVISNGVAYVLESDTDSIQISIVWGLFKKFSKMISDGKSLNELESKERIMFNSPNVADTYENALLKNIFYADYSIWANADEDYTWETDMELTSPAVDESEIVYQNSYTFGSNHTGVTETIHPVVKVSWILSLIKDNTNINFNFGDASDFINSLIVPLVKKDSNELTYDGDFAGIINPTTSKGTLPIHVNSASTIFNATGNTDVSSLTVNSDVTAVIDFEGIWGFDMSTARKNGSGTSFPANGKSYNYDSYIFSYGYYVRINVTGNSGSTDYDIGQSAKGFIVKVKNGYKGEVKLRYKGYGKIELKKGDVVTLKWNSGGSLPNATFYGASISATVIDSEEVPYGSYFPIAINLPEAKITDFVKCLCVLAGVFPKQMSNDGEVDMIPIKSIWSNKSKAKDWTKRVIPYANINKATDITYKLSDYAQHNLYKWKTDDTVTGDYDGDMTIDNDTLDATRTVVEFPFAASDGSSVPMYTRPDSYVDGSGFGQKTGSTTTTTSATYKACVDRLMVLSKDSSGKAIATFDLDMKKILKEKYSELWDTLNNAKLIKETMKMRDSELLNFDETIPIYLAQYGSYFAVTEITSKGDGTAEVTLLKLKL